MNAKQATLDDDLFNRPFPLGDFDELVKPVCAHSVTA
jgi:hypothetical protein